MDYFLSFFSKVIQNGYSIVPIAPGSKYPKGFKEWQKTDFTPNLCSRLIGAKPELSHYGLGIKTGNGLVALDIDVFDSIVVDKLCFWLQSELGETIYRLGQKPKILALYNWEGEDPGKILSNSYTDCIGVRNKIEVLSIGQQFVAFHTHPETKQAYRWVDNKSVLQVSKNDLPFINSASLEKFFQFFYSIAPDDWTLSSATTHVGKNRHSELENPLISISGKADVTKEYLESCLKLISAEDYATWVQVGQALHHQFDGGSIGFSLWDNWSKGSQKYPGESQCKRKWSTFLRDVFCKEPVTAKTIVYLAKKEGKTELREDKKNEDSKLPEFLDRFVFLSEGSRVVDLFAPPHLPPMRIQDFRYTFASKKESREGICSKSGKPKTTFLSVTRLWVESEERKTAQSEMYAPGESRVFSDAQNIKWVNCFNFPDHGCVEEPARLALFEKHISYLFPIEEEKVWFLQWMAFTVQRPEMRCKVTPLHVNKLHGTGRGWLVELMTLLIGEWNCSETKMQWLCGESSAGAYHDYLYRTKFCSIPEVKLTGKAYEVDDKIRAILESPRLELNLKYGSKGTYRVYTNFFLQSNHPNDALALPKEDRRIQVLTGSDYLESNAYFEEMYTWLKDQKNIHQLWDHLTNLDLSTFNFQRSTNTIGRERLIGGYASELEIAINHISKNRTELDYLDAKQRVREILGWEIDDKQLKAALRGKGWIVSSNEDRVVFYTNSGGYSLQ